MIKDRGAVQWARVARGGVARTTRLRLNLGASSDLVQAIDGVACAEADVQWPFDLVAPLVLNASAVQ